jgi:hypothetical protein
LLTSGLRKDLTKSASVRVMLSPIFHHIDETSLGLFTPLNQAEFDSLKHESVYNFQTACLANSGILAKSGSVMEPQYGVLVRSRSIVKRPNRSPIG